MKITVLVDHEASSDSVDTEWGASIHIRWRAHSILFDMGTSGLFADNARILGVPIEDVNFAVVSHSHLDHGGGLARFFSETNAPVWARAGMTPDLFMKLGPIRKRVGIDADVVGDNADRFRFVDRDTEVVPGVHLLTAISNEQPAPRGNRVLMRGEGGRLVPDDFSHELALVIEDDGGLVVFTGCSHHGVLNIVESARRAFPDSPVKALVGGFHFMGIPIAGLLGESSAAIEDVAGRLGAMAIPQIITMHCTTRKGYETLQRAYGPGITYAGAGASVEL
ncbi:MAG: beta-lactamase domain-containing [Actinobacteria bacterium]|nr:MAG: beta-lactamase domain-containing [Actinomycetota bacterium]